MDTALTKPSTILCIAPYEYSHLRLSLNLAAALTKRGHTIVYCGFSDLRTILNGKYELLEIAQEERPVQTLTNRYHQQAQLSGHEALLNLVKNWNSDILLYLTYLPEAIQDRDFDLVIFDQAMIGIYTLIEFLDIASVEICNALAIDPYELLFHPFYTAPFQDYTLNPIKVLANVMKGIGSLNRFYSDLIVELNVFRKEHGMKKIHLTAQLLLTNSNLKLAQLIPELDYPKLMFHTSFHFLGSFSYRPVTKIDAPYNLEAINKPIIYATIGTLQNKNVQILQRIDKACATMDVQLVITLGLRLADPNSIKGMFSQHTIVYDFAPQQQLIKQASMTIIHAGLNSTLESLCYGKPIICIPIAHEQNAIAARMKRAKVAEIINSNELGIQNITTAIDTILSDESYAERAQGYGEMIRDAGGLERGVELIEELLGGG